MSTQAASIPGGRLVDPTFLGELERFGAFDVKACFNCGNCTATCPLTTEDEKFPRRIIRLAQIGDRSSIVASKELWLCYYCGECSVTCRREAEPGEFMASARRYAIASFDPTGLARWLYTSWTANVAAFVAVSALLLWFMLRHAGPVDGRFFEFVSGHTIHDMGIVVIAVTVIAAILGIANMSRRIWVETRGKAKPPGGKKKGLIARVGGAIGHVISEWAAEGRYRDCSDPYAVSEPWYRARWLVHWCILWGFVGLLVATTWNFLFKPEYGAWVPLWYPARLIGTIAGILLVYGAAMALWQRLRPTIKYAEHTLHTDWIFLAFLFLLGVSGFILEILDYTAPATVTGNIVLLLHIVLGFEIVLMLPFTKFAHVMYRSLALFVHALAQE